MIKAFYAQKSCQHLQCLNPLLKKKYKRANPHSLNLSLQAVDPPKENSPYLIKNEQDIYPIL